MWYGLGPRKVWLGYQQSLRPCESGLTLNVDLAATAFLQVQVWPWPSWALLRPCNPRPHQVPASHTQCPINYLGSFSFSASAPL